jgi:hypothetical protein
MIKQFLFISSLFLFLASMPPETHADPFWKTVLRVTGISATPSQLKSVSDEIEGDIWVVDLTQENRLIKVTSEGRYHSPVFLPGNQQILALKDGKVVQVSVAGGNTTILYTIKGLVKIVGFVKDNQDNILILRKEDGGLLAGLLSLKTGQIMTMPYDRESKRDRQMLAHLTGWERVYDDTRVYVKAENKPGIIGSIEWTDVFIQQGNGTPVNISRCDGENCGQPSISSDRKFVVFIKQTQ